MKTQSPRPHVQTRDTTATARPKGEQAISTDLYEQIRAALRELNPVGR